MTTCPDHTPSELPAIEHHFREVREFTERVAFPRSNPVDLKKEQPCKALRAAPSTLMLKKETAPEPIFQACALIDSTADVKEVVGPDRTFEKGNGDEDLSLEGPRDTRRQSLRLAKQSRYIRYQSPTARRTVIRRETAQFPAGAQKPKRRRHPIEVVIPSRDMRFEKLDYDGLLHDKDDRMINDMAPSVTNEMISYNTDEKSAVVTDHQACQHQMKGNGRVASKKLSKRAPLHEIGNNLT